MANDEARKLSTVQEIMIRGTDYLPRIIAPAGEQGGVAMAHLCPHCNSFPMEDYVWWVSGKKSKQIGGVRSVEKNTTGSLLVLQGESVNQAKVFKAHTVPQAYEEFNQCVDVNGKSARGWRRPHTEHRDEPQ